MNNQDIANKLHKYSQSRQKESTNIYAKNVHNSELGAIILELEINEE